MKSPKEVVGRYAAKFVERGMTFGLGTGTTVLWLIEELGERVRQGLSIRVVPTSRQTAQLAIAQQIPVVELNDVNRLPLTIDGADEVDALGNLIKGGGGALLQEKIVASASQQLIIIADAGKKVKQLGRFPLPVEVVPFAQQLLLRRIKEETGCSNANLRRSAGEPFVTDHGHYILDCSYGIINDPVALNSQLHSFPGVVETGLFNGMATTAIFNTENGSVEEIRF